MSPTKTRQPEEIKRELRRLRPQITRTKGKLEDLYDKQNLLYVEGHRAGLRATDMARAIGADNIASGAEAIRQVVKRDGGAPTARGGSKSR